MMANPAHAMISRVARTIRKMRKLPVNLPEGERQSLERYRFIAFSGGASLVARLVSAFVGLASVPMVVHHVGKDQFGLWMVVSSLVVWMQLADFGITNGLSNALTEAHGRDDVDAASNYLSSSLVATMLIAAIGLPLLSVGYIYVPWGEFLGISSPALLQLAGDAFLVVGLAFIANIPASLAGRAFIAYQRGYVTSFSQAIGSVLSFAGMWVAVRNGAPLLWLVAISAFSPVLVNVALWPLLKGLDPRLKFRSRGINQTALLRVANSSVPLFFFQCGALLVNQLVNVMVARLANLAVVADYNMILRIYLFAFSMAASLSSPFYAPIRSAFERNDMQWVTKAIKRSLMVRVLSLLPFVLLLIPFGDFLLRSWVGTAMAVTIGMTGWTCVGISLLLSSVSSLLSETLSSLDDIWAQIALVFLSAAIVIGVMTVLIPLLGVSGVFLAMGISTLLPIAWLAQRLSRKFSIA